MDDSSTKGVRPAFAREASSGGQAPPPGCVATAALNTNQRRSMADVGNLEHGISKLIVGEVAKTGCSRSHPNGCSSGFIGGFRVLSEGVEPIGQKCGLRVRKVRRVPGWPPPWPGAEEAHADCRQEGRQHEGPNRS